MGLSFSGGCGGFDDGATPVEDAPTSRLTTAAEPPALDCATYCAVLMRRCRDSTRQFDSLAACAAACAAYPADGAVGTAVGDTLQCRFTFALAARKSTRYSFCRNAGPSGGVACN